MKTDSPYNGSGSLTREQFLFYEMRTTAKLKSAGLSNVIIVEKIARDNLFQFPTEKSVKRIASACIARLDAMNDETLVEAVASQPSEIAKQICLYAIMKHRRLIWDFMLTVIGEKYRIKDSSFGKIDLNIFFMRLQEQDNNVASWSDATVQKLKQVLTRILVENEYLDSTKACRLNPVWLNSILENAMRSHNDDIALPAFNCFI
jgi:hypothetical protein